MPFLRQKKDEPRVDLTPMVDVVFLLLIFFMLTANAPNALDLLLPRAKGKSTNQQNVSVTINKNLEYFVNNEQINGEYIEIELKKALEGQDKPTIILRAEESVAIREAVNVMDIANRNNYKVILAVRPN